MRGGGRGDILSDVRVQVPPLFRTVEWRDRRAAQVVAGLTLASIAVPEVLGFARIAGMPVATGLYTMLLPSVVFVAFCSSRHMVVGADSATAAILGAGFAGIAVAGSHDYVRLAGVVAVATGVVLLVARLLRMGFIADFLSRTLLVGFLAGVGIKVAFSQLPDMFGIPVRPDGPVRTVLDVIAHLDEASAGVLVLSVVTILVVVGGGRLARRVPWALLMVVGSITASALGWIDVPTFGHVDRGLPVPGWPTVDAEQLWHLVPIVLAVAVVILAQSAATARVYADRYDERDDVDGDLLALGAANLVAGVTGTFVVNGSPPRTQIVDSAGGRNQLAQLVAAASALVAVLFLTPALSNLPHAVLASIIAVITIRMVDVGEIRDVFLRRRAEGVVVIAAAVTVVVFGVGPGVLFAALLSVAVHLRHSYRPSTRLVGRDGKRWRMSRTENGRQAEPGLVIYFVPANLYYANATFVADEIDDLVRRADPPLEWLCLFGIAIDDVDLTASDMLKRLVSELRGRGVQLVMCGVEPRVRAEFDRDGITDLVGPERFFDYLEDVVAAFRQRS